MRLYGDIVTYRRREGGVNWIGIVLADDRLTITISVTVWVCVSGGVCVCKRRRQLRYINITLSLEQPKRTTKQNIVKRKVVEIRRISRWFYVLYDVGWMSCFLEGSFWKLGHIFFRTCSPFPFRFISPKKSCLLGWKQAHHLIQANVTWSGIVRKNRAFEEWPTSTQKSLTTNLKEDFFGIKN